MTTPSYPGQTWVDDDVTKPVSAARMMVIEQGIKDAHAAAAAASAAAAAGGKTNPFDPTGATDNTAKIQAAINAIKVQGGVIDFAPGTYRIDGQLNLNGAYNVTLRGSGLQGADRIGPWNTTLQFTKSGSTPCITARSSQGCGFLNLATVYTNTAYTGSIFDTGSPGDPVPTYRPTWKNCYVGGPGGTTITAKNAYAGIWLGQVVEPVIEHVVFGRTQYGIVGRASTEPTFSNAVLITGGRFADMGIAAILNPFENWTVISTVFEPSITGAPAGIVCTSQFPARGITLVGASFWDTNLPGVWIDFWGTGLNVEGVYAELNTATLYRLNSGVWGFRSVGGFVFGTSSAKYIEVANAPFITNFETKDGMGGGVVDNTYSIASSAAFTPNYQPTLKRRVLTAGTIQLNQLDCGASLMCNSSGGNVTLLMPPPTDAPGGMIFVKKTDTSGNVVVANGFVLAGVNAARLFISDGTAWHTASIVPSH